MSVQMQSQQVMCARCGHPAGGRFCTNCGDRIGPQAVGVLGLAASDLFELDERRGFLSVLWKLLKQPVTAAVELALDRQWHGHSAFFFSRWRLQHFRPGYLRLHCRNGCSHRPRVQMQMRLLETSTILVQPFWLT